MAAHWIQQALGGSSKGALHRMLGVPVGQPIGKAKIAKAANSSNPLEAKRARLAETLGKLRKK